MNYDRTITARVQLRLAIDPAMQAPGSVSRPPMNPQVIEVAIHSDLSSSKTAAWDHEFWIDTPYEATASTWNEARDKILNQLSHAPFLAWMLHMLPVEDSLRAIWLQEHADEKKR